MAIWAASAANAAISVSAGGQAATGVPLAVPPGIAGMVPNLALSYVDGGINGPVGVGWSLQGVSTISRCPATRALDTIGRSVDFTSADKLCLDGQRLIQVNAQGVPAAFPQSMDASGIPKDAGGNALPFLEFRTEKDTYARIRAYPSASVEDGPSYFKVWTKAGQIYEYGTNPNNNANAIVRARLLEAETTRTPVAVWAVSRISDIVGNFIDFKYVQREVSWGSGPLPTPTPGWEWNLGEVQYTGNAAQAPHNKIVFEYQDRADDALPGFDRSEAYQRNNKNVSVQLLTTIRTYVNSPNPTALGAASSALEVRTVKLAYSRSSQTGRSRLVSVTQCVGPSGPSETQNKCLPPTRFAYADNGNGVSFSANGAFAISSLATLKLHDVAGSFGLLTGDFNGDGRTDILRWSNTPSENQLWLSAGGGSFNEASGFNITSENLGQSDGCVASVVADFNGDGLSDILRVTDQKPNCPVGPSLLFLSTGNGGFSQVALPAPINLSQRLSKKSSQGGVACTPPAIATAPGRSPVLVPQSDAYGPAATGVPVESGPPSLNGSCTRHWRPTGQRFYVIDLNGDGILDFVTTTAPEYNWNSGWGAIPSEDHLCLGLGNPSFAGPCTRVYRGSIGSANVPEYTEIPTDVADFSLYSHPAGLVANSYWRLPSLADIDGDGLLDILAQYTGKWRSRGDGNFASSVVRDIAQVCASPIDANGDLRSDCLRVAESAADQGLTLSYGATSSPYITQFNLKTGNNNLFAEDGSQRQTVGHIVEDFDGDGRQDILRWGQTNSDVGIYLSNGDGSFRTREPSGLDAISRPLQAVDGTATFVLGDFLGVGSVQILHLKSAPSNANAPASSNQLYQRVATGLADVLVWVTSPAGLKSQIDQRTLLTSANAYISERGTAQAATSPMVDLQIPMQVITSVTRDTGAGLLTTRYRYKGLKAERGGRGLLGFREMRQQNPAPDGSLLTVATEYLLPFPYTGVAARSRTFRSGLDLSGPQLSETSNIYCDKTSPTDPASAAETTPCLGTSPLKRPYVRKTVEQGWDLDGTTLPVVTTVSNYNDFGDPTSIEVTTVASFAGATRTYLKTTTNDFCTSGAGGCPNTIAGDNWILGRLMSSQVTNTVPNLLGALSTSPGTSPTATATQGTLTFAASGDAQLTPATLPAFADTPVGGTAEQAVQLRNGGAGALTVSAIGATGDFSVFHFCPATLAPNATCDLTVSFTPTVAGPRSGLLTINNGGASGNKSVNLSGNGVLQGLSLDPVAFGNVTVGNASTLTSTLRNTGGSSVNVTVPGAGSVIGQDFSFVSTTCGASLAAGSNCTVSIRFQPTAAVARSGSLTVNTAAGNLAANLSGAGVAAAPGDAELTPTSLAAFADTQIGDTSVAQAIQLRNVGAGVLTLGVIAVSNSDFNVTHTCPASLASNATCDISVRFTPTAAGARGGSLTINNNGSSGNKTVGLSGNGRAQSGTLDAIAFGNVTVGSPSTLTSTLRNTGVGAMSVTIPGAGSVSGQDYSFVSTTCGASLSVGGSCTVSVRFQPTAEGARSGALTVGTGAGSLVANLSGTGVLSAQGNAQLTPAVLPAFADTQIGDTSAAQVAQLKNVGTGTLTLLGAITSSNSDFVVTHNCPATLAPEASCDITSRFTPTAVGARGAVVSINNNGSSGNKNLFLSGNGRTQGGTLDAITFGNVTVGSASTLTSTLRNTGVGSLSVTVPAAGSVTGQDFSFVTTGCGASLGVGGTCTVSVRFQPTGDGERTGALVVSTGAGNLSATLTGTGVVGQGNAQLIPATLPAFADTQVGDSSPLQNIQLKNSGTGALAIGSISATGEFGVSSNCPATLLPDASCNVSIVFAPPAAAPFSGVLTIINNGASGNRTVNLSGTGRAQSGTLSPASHDFGNTPLGGFSDLAVTLTNNGVGTLSIGSAAFTNGVFTLVNPTCGLTLPAGQSCGGTIRFTPTAAGAAAATFTLQTGAGLKSISLQGAGQPGNAGVSPTSLTFANTQVQQTTAAQTVTVTNTGVGQLTITQALATPTSDYITQHSCSVVTVGSSCTISISFRPSQVGSRPGVLTISNNGVSGERTVALNGTGQGASATLTSLNFGTVSTGQTAGPLSARLTNTGIGPLNISSGPFIDNDTTMSFSYTGNHTCFVTLNPGDSCTGDFTFTPSQAGPLSAILRLVTTEAGTITSLLEGVGSGDPALTVPLPNGELPGRIDLMGAIRGSQSTQLTIRNGGPATLNNIAVTCQIAGGQVLTPPATSLARGATTTFVVGHVAGGKCGVRITASNGTNSPFVLGGY